MNSRRGGLTVPLHVNLGRRNTIELRVIVDECEVLNLFWGIVGSHLVTCSYWLSLVMTVNSLGTTFSNLGPVFTWGNSPRGCNWLN